MANIKIGNKDFESKKSAFEHISKVFRLNGSRTFKEGSDNFNFLLDLLKRHPQAKAKLANGIVAFEVVMKNEARGNYTVYIVDHNGCKIDFSWRKCISAPKSKDYLSEAMRNTVRPQIEKFFVSARKSCNLCGSIDYLEVDHIVKFREIKEKFLLTTEHNVPKSFDFNKSGNHSATFKYEDYKFEKHWFHFHKCWANLRILCRSCNLKNR